MIPRHMKPHRRPTPPVLSERQMRWVGYVLMVELVMIVVLFVTLGAILWRVS